MLRLTKTRAEMKSDTERTMKPEPLYKLGFACG